MDPDGNTTLEQLFTRASRSALKSLDAVVDVEQRLRDLYRDVGHDQQTEDRSDHETT